jgi:gluconolactonase
MAAPSTVSWELLTAGHGLLEAPTPAPDGSVWISDVFIGGVRRWTCSEVSEPLLARRKGIGGLALHEDGGLLVSGRDLVHLSADGSQRTVLAVEGATGVNDLTTDSTGRVYAGVLRYRPFAGDQVVPGEIWRIELDGSAAPIAGDIAWPNGMAFSPDGSMLYVADFASGEVLGFDPDGGRRRAVAQSPSAHADGLAVDADGELWVALGPAGAVARFRPDGELVQTIGPPASFASSVAFGGTDGRTLYVTTGDAAAGGGALFSTRVEVPGVPVAPARV